MSIALESGRVLGGGARFRRVGRFGYSASPPASAGRSSVGRDSDSPAAAARWEWDGEEVEGGDGEVQSSYKGSPFDTMDALQEALPFRKGVCKFYNGKSGSFGRLKDTVITSPPQKDQAKPETPSPRKRKGLLPFTFKWGRSQHKEVFPEDVVDSPTNCRRMTSSPTASSSSGSNSGSDDEHYLSQKPSSRRPQRRLSNAKDVFASPPAPRPPQLNPVYMRSQSTLELQDVTESTDLVSPRDKRMKHEQDPNLDHSQGKVHEQIAKPESFQRINQI